MLLIPLTRVGATFNKNLLVDDAIFNDVNSMSATKIDSFLNSQPNSCISTNSGFEARTPSGYTPSGGFTYGNFTTAGQVIYTAAQIYGLNPQILVVTLQKEQGLVTGEGINCNSSNENKYAAATGYGCPDNVTNHAYSNVSLYRRNGVEHTSVSLTCVNSSLKAGFSQQLIRAAWLLKFSQQRALGNVGWAIIIPNWDNSDDLPVYYSGYMTQGTFKRSPTDSPVFYDGYATIDGMAIHIDTGATAALYRYTPHLAGNQNFVNLFEQWFSPTLMIKDNVTMNIITQPDTTPFVGQTVSYTVSLTNNLNKGNLNIDAVGIVGRQGSLNNGANRDFGWVGPIILKPRITQNFTFNSIIKDTGTLYAWLAINYKGVYIHYNNWGVAMSVRTPNLSLVSPLVSSANNPVVGQTSTLSATIKNNENEAISLSAIGIPIRYYGVYNYDTAWTVPSGGIIQPQGTQTVTGNVKFDKIGPYTAWLSALITNQYTTLSSKTIINVKQAIPNFSLTYIETPNTSPALGEDVVLKFKLKNNLGVAMTLDAVGIVGRYNNPYTGTNRDFGWVGPESFAPKEEKIYTIFKSNISELKNFYAWVAIKYQGKYINYNNWGFFIVPRKPNITTTAPISINSGSTPILGATSQISVTIKNNEPNPIHYLALGIPARYFGQYNYDTLWLGAGTLASSGNSGDTISLTGSVIFDKPGPYTIWASININGNYVTIGNKTAINL